MQEYFSEDFEIISFVKNEKECTANINCNIVSYNGVNSFVRYYTKGTNETLKLKFKKKETERRVFTKSKLFTGFIMIHDTKEQEILGLF